MRYSVNNAFAIVKLKTIQTKMVRRHFINLLIRTFPAPVSPPEGGNPTAPVRPGEREEEEEDGVKAQSAAELLRGTNRHQISKDIFYLLLNF